MRSIQYLSFVGAMNQSQFGNDTLRPRAGFAATLSDTGLWAILPAPLTDAFELDVRTTGDESLGTEDVSSIPAWLFEKDVVALAMELLNVSLADSEPSTGSPITGSPISF